MAPIVYEVPATGPLALMAATKLPDMPGSVPSSVTVYRTSPWAFPVRASNRITTAQAGTTRLADRANESTGGLSVRYLTFMFHFAISGALIRTELDPLLPNISERHNPDSPPKGKPVYIKCAATAQQSASKFPPNGWQTLERTPGGPTTKQNPRPDATMPARQVQG